MSGPSDRRGFLRGLSALPLIGGGVTIVGSPTASAEPVTRDLLDAYDEWLDLERRFLRWERYGTIGWEQFDRQAIEVVYRNRETGRCFDFRTCNTVQGDRHGQPGDSPSARAAVVLSAAGCGWRQQ